MSQQKKKKFPLQVISQEVSSPGSNGDSEDLCNRWRGKSQLSGLRKSGLRSSYWSKL